MRSDSLWDMLLGLPTSDDVCRFQVVSLSKRTPRTNTRGGSDDFHARRQSFRALVELEGIRYHMSLHQRVPQQPNVLRITPSRRDLGNVTLSSIVDADVLIAARHLTGSRIESG